GYMAGSVTASRHGGDVSCSATNCEGGSYFQSGVSCGNRRPTGSDLWKTHFVVQARSSSEAVNAIPGTWRCEAESSARFGCWCPSKNTVPGASVCWFVHGPKTRPKAECWRGSLLSFPCGPHPMAHAMFQ